MIEACCAKVSRYLGIEEPEEMEGVEGTRWRVRKVKASGLPPVNLKLLPQTNQTRDIHSTSRGPAIHSEFHYSSTTLLAVTGFGSSLQSLLENARLKLRRAPHLTSASTILVTVYRCALRPVP